MVKQSALVLAPVSCVCAEVLALKIHMRGTFGFAAFSTCVAPLVFFQVVMVSCFLSSRVADAFAKVMPPRAASRLSTMQKPVQVRPVSNLAASATPIYAEKSFM